MQGVIKVAFLKNRIKQQTQHLMLMHISMIFQMFQL